MQRQLRTTTPPYIVFYIYKWMKRKTYMYILAFTSAAHYFFPLCFLTWRYRVTPSNTYGLLFAPQICGLLKEKWISLLIVWFSAERCNKDFGIEHQKMKHGSTGTRSPYLFDVFISPAWGQVKMSFSLKGGGGLTLSFVSQSSVSSLGLPDTSRIE